MGLCVAIENRQPYVDNRIANSSMISEHEGGPIHPLAESCVTFLMLHASSDPKGLPKASKVANSDDCIVQRHYQRSQGGYNRRRTEGLQQKF